MKARGKSSDDAVKKPSKSSMAGEFRCKISLMVWVKPNVVLAVKKSLKVKEVIITPSLPNGSRRPLRKRTVYKVIVYVTSILAGAKISIYVHSIKRLLFKNKYFAGILIYIDTSIQSTAHMNL